jgi:DNA polymerase III delta subunit
MDEPRHTLLVGPEPLRRHFREGSGHLVVDAAEEDPASALLSAGLFTSSVRIVRAEETGAADVERLAHALGTTPLTVTIEAEKLHPANEKKLSAVCRIVKLSLGTNAGRIIRDIAGRLGLDPGEQAVDELIERLSHDPGRLVGTLEALAAGGYVRPNVAQVRLLAGSSREEGLPWHLLDDLDGKANAASETLPRLEAIPTIAFLAKRVRIATFASEHPDRDRVDAVTLLGEISEGAWRQGRKLAERLGAERCRALLPVLADADTRAKRGQAEAALRLAAGAYRLAVITGRGHS